MDAIPVEIKKQILQQEISMYHNTRYQLEIRHRINKKLGNTPEQLKAIENELVKIESALAELDIIEKEFEKSIK